MIGVLSRTSRLPHDPFDVDVDESVLEQQLAEARDRIAYLEGQVKEARADRDLLRDLINAQEQELPTDTVDLLTRIADLETESIRLRASCGGREELLRERDTNRRLEAELDRLTQASIAADRRRW